VSEEIKPIHEARLWKDDGWTAQVIKNEDDEGWAVAMIKDGEPEPALVGPWTMGRNKKDPKPLDNNSFFTLVKTATEYVRRHEQQLHATLHKSFLIDRQVGRVDVRLDIFPNEDEPYAMLSARDIGATDEDLLAQKRVAPSFNFTRTVASDWVDKGFK
jgi:hypothetical protein